MNTFTRKEARQEGLMYYFTGKPCKRGHICKRKTSSGSCVKCCTGYTKKWYDNNPGKKSEYDKKYYDEHQEDLVNYRKQYYEENKETILEKCRESYQKDPEPIKARSRKYHHLHKEQYQEQYEKNKEKYREQNKVWYEKNRNYTRSLARKRRKKNKSKFIQYDRLYKSMRQQAQPKWLTEHEKEQMILLYDQARHLTKTTGIKHTVDHIIPICNKKVCGLHVLQNLQILTQSENSSKGNKLLCQDY